MATRREFLGASSALFGTVLVGGATGLPSSASGAAKTALLQRPIPSSGEMVPVIGMGTSGSFQVSPNGPEYQALKEVLNRFVDGGGKIIDTAPTYGNAEDNLGTLFRASGLRPRTFIATKLSGVSGVEQGLEQFASTLRRLGTDKVELLQVHNLGDWKTQLEVARRLKAEGKIRYVGLTHYVESAQDQLADAVQASKPDFLQINYSVRQRGAEKRVFPLAKQLGVAVLANRNFEDGALFDRVQGKSLPSWAAEAGVTSWAQMFLKFALSHDAVTVVIPATGKPDRQSDNLKAGLGPMLTQKQKADLVALVG
ncbi:MAG: aldo/keto reductase [Steroidobacteraceae bacterium]|nr:aldo/keto reductase [Steroidobacteraceae bacterium]